MCEEFRFCIFEESLKIYFFTFSDDFVLCIWILVSENWEFSDILHASESESNLTTFDNLFHLFNHPSSPTTFSSPSLSVSLISPHHLSPSSWSVCTIVGDLTSKIMIVIWNPRNGSWNMRFMIIFALSFIFSFLSNQVKNLFLTLVEMDCFFKLSMK